MLLYGLSAARSYLLINTVVFNQTKNHTMYCDVKRRTKIIIRPGGTKQYVIRPGVTKQYVIRPGGPNNMYACVVHKLNNVRWFNKTNGL